MSAEDQKVLAVRGASTTDELGEFGAGFASSFASADHVFLDGRPVKGHGLALETFDVKPMLGELAGIVEEIRIRYESAYPDSAHLSHCYVGLWMFYWMTSDKPYTPVQMMLACDVDELRASARAFIESDFAFSVGRIRPDEDRRAEAAGSNSRDQAADGAPETVPRAGGERHESRANR